MPSISNLIPVYLTACAVEGKTDRTVQSYAESLRQLAAASEALGLPSDVEDFGTAEVYRFLGWVKARGVSAGTQHRRQREIKAFFSWCRRLGHIPENPFSRVPMVRREQKIIQPFSARDIQALLAASDPECHYGCRNRAMILFLLDTGVRASELAAARIEDVFWQEHRVRILQGKGRKQRWTGIGDEALAALRLYLDRFRGWEPGPLFRTVDGRPLRSHHLNVVFTRLGRRAGVANVHPHRFRHTFATWAIRASARELDVQYLLGHSTPVMVRRYAATYDSEQAAAAHAAFSPVAQLRAGA